MDKVTLDLLESQEKRRIASIDRMRQRNKGGNNSNVLVEPGTTTFQRTIHTGSATGSEPYRMNPEDIVVGGAKASQRRTDFENVNRREKPLSEE